MIDIRNNEYLTKRDHHCRSDTIFAYDKWECLCLEFISSMDIVLIIIMFFRYGAPDPDLIRPHDVNIRLRMGSVRYVHTNRFLQEVLAFLQHFNQLQDVLGRMRAASAGQKVHNPSL